jgi:hypothetical protein
MGLASLGLDIGIFCELVKHSPINSGFVARFFRASPVPDAVCTVPARETPHDTSPRSPSCSASSRRARRSPGVQSSADMRSAAACACASIDAAASSLQCTGLEPRILLNSNAHIGTFSQTAGSTCKFWVNPVNVTFRPSPPPAPPPPASAPELESPPPAAPSPPPVAPPPERESC